jgi:DNA transformation protein and related proteins
MTTDATLLSTVLDLLSGMGVLRQRKMFGGVYIYCDDLFIATIHDDTLYFKANANTAADFVARGLPIFSYPKKGGIATLQYYRAPPEVFTARAPMKMWAAKALLAAKQDAAMKTRKKVSASKTQSNSKTKAKKGKRRRAAT